MTRETPPDQNPQYTSSEPRTERIEDIDRWVEEHGYTVEFHGKDIQVIILGEWHGAQELIDAQIELIKLVKPSLILHEELKGGDAYDPKEDVFHTAEHGDLPGVRTVPDKFYETAHELGTPVIGCDLPLRELAKRLRPDLAEFVIKALDTRDPATFEAFFLPLSKSDEGIAMREEKMINTILQQLAKSDGPVVIILGYVHTENFNHLQLLQNRGVGYAIINQTGIALARGGLN